MSQAGSDSEVVVELAEEFIDRYRRGEQPPLTEYTSRYPHLKEQIEDVFPAMAMIENIAIRDSSGNGRDSADVEQRPAHPLSIGEYRIIREVGRGGMGIVYEAEQLSLGRRVALKVLPQHVLLDKKHKRRFEREARAAAKLHHTNIVPVFGVGEQDGLHYYVMQFIQGLGLDEVIGELRRMREALPSAKSAFHAELRSSGRGQDVSPGRVARSLMTGEFERTVLTDGELPAEDGPSPLGSTVGDEAPTPKPSATGPGPQIEVQQSGAGPVELALESSGLKASSTRRLSDSFTLSGSLSLPGGDDASGSTSGSRARRKQTFWTSVAHIGQQVASALQYAHEQGITHRDIKPSNLLLDMQGTVWVTDFGLAKTSDQQDITHTGDILGTLRYMPPEAFEGKSDARGDLYSLGLTLYELLAQKPAFDEKDRHKLIKLVTTTEPVRIEKLKSDVPRDLATIVHKAIDRDPSRRYSSARELVDDLQRFLDDEPIRARRISTAERIARWSRHNRGLATSLAAVCVLLLVINIAGPVLTWQLNVAQQQAAREAARYKSLAERQTSLAEAAETDRRGSQTMLADLETERGFLAARDHAPAEAAVWFAKAASETPHDPHRQAMNGLRARNWLNQACLPVASFVLEGHGQPRKVEFQPNGQLLLTLHTTGAQVWDSWAEQALPWSNNLKNATDACWSPDGHSLACAFRSGEMQVRDVRTGNISETLRHAGEIRAIAWSPDGLRLAIGGTSQVDVWNLDGESKLEFSWPQSASVESIVFNRSGDRLATSSNDNLVRLYAVSGNRLRKQPVIAPLPHYLPPLALEGPIFRPPLFVDQDRAIITVKPDRRLGWWSTVTGEDITPDSFQVTGNPTGRLFGSRDGVWFGAAGIDSAYKFEVRNIDGRAFTLPHSNAVQDVEFLPGNEAVVTTSWNGTARIWSLPPGTAPLLTIPQSEAVVLTAVSGNGTLALCGSGDVSLWRQSLADAALAEVGDWSASHRRPRPGFDGRLATLGVWHESPGHWTVGNDRLRVVQLENAQPAGPEIVLPGQFWDSCLSADNRTVAVVCKSGAAGAVGFYDIATGTANRPVIALSSLPQSIAARPGHPHVAVLCQDGTLRVFDHRQGTLLHNLHEGASCQLSKSRVAWSPDGSALVTLNDRLQVVVRDAETGLPRFRPITPEERCQFHTLAFSDDGRWLATAVNGRRHDVQVWDLDAGNPAGPPLSHPGAGDTYGIFAVAFSPDGESLLTGDKDGRARLWDWRSGKLRCPPMAHTDEVYDVAFTADGRFALTAVRKGRVHLWDLVSGKPVAPPLPLPTPDALTLGIGGDRVVVGAPGYPVFSLSTRLNEPDVPIDALQTNAELACGRSMQLGELAPIEQSEWVKRWTSFHQSWSNNAALVDRLLRRIDATSDAGTHRTIARQALHLGVLDHLAELRPKILPLQLLLLRELVRTGDTPASIRLGEGIVRVLAAPLPDDPSTAAELACWILESQEIRRAGPSVTNESVDPEIERWRLAARTLDDPWLKLGAAYVVADDRARAAESFSRALKGAPGIVAQPELVERIAGLRLDRGDLLTLRPDDPLLLSALAERPAAAGETDAVLPDSRANKALAGFLAELLLADTTRWTVLKPVDMTSTGGTAFTLQSDGSILPGGQNPDSETYTIVSDMPLDHICALRLEVLPHPEIQNGATGRGDLGYFTLTEVTATVAASTDVAQTRAVRFDSATASYERDDQEGHEILTAIDGRRDNGSFWNTYPLSKLPATVIFEIAPVAIEGTGGRFAVNLDFNHRQFLRHNLGCFRLSVTDDPTAFEMCRRRFLVSRIKNPRERLYAAFAALGDSNRAAEWLAKALERPPDSGARLELVKLTDELQVDLEDLLALCPNDPLLLRDVAKHQAEAGEEYAAATSLSRARSLTESLLDKSPADGTLAALLADLLLTDTSKWTVLDPTDMTSAGGATLTLQNEGSILASGENPAADVYTIRAAAGIPEVRAIRLEAIPDPSLPNQGPGRHASGNFHLDTFRVFAATGDNGKPADRLQIANAQASFAYNEFGNGSVLGTIEDDNPTFWQVFGRAGERHVAVFELATPLKVQPGQSLILQCVHTGRQAGLNLGRFRLSVTADQPHLVAAEQQRWSVIGINNPWERLGAAYAAVGNSAQAAEWFSRALQQAAGFKARREIVERIDRLQADLGDLIALRPDDPLLWGALAKRQASARQTEAAAESLARARSLTAALLAESPADGALAAIADDLRLAAALLSISWTVPVPTEMTSNGGATLERQSDGSIFVSGENPDEDLYTIVLPLTSAKVTALRLETLVDERLPFAASGRSPLNGNFHLGELSLSLRSASDPAAEKALPVTWAHADVTGSEGRVMRRAIDGDRTTQWTPYPLQNRNHLAVFQFQLPPGVTPENGQLVVRLDTGPSRWPHHGLGRFRLSITDDAAAPK